MIAVDLEALNFTISPPVYGSQCVLNYTITSTDSDGAMDDITVEVTDTEATITLMQSGFDLCGNIYSFTAEANTLIGPGERSEVVPIESQQIPCGNSPTSKCKFFVYTK